MNAIFCILAAVTIVMFVAVASADTVICSKSSLSLGCGPLVIPFFFGRWATLVIARFPLCFDSKLVSEFRDSLLSLDKSQIVFVSTTILSGKGCTVIVGLAMQSVTLLAQRSFFRRSLSVSSWSHGDPPFLVRKGKLGMCIFFTVQNPQPSSPPRPYLKIFRNDLVLLSFL